MKQQRAAYLSAFVAVALWSTMATAFTLGLREMDGLQLMLGASCVSIVCLGVIAAFRKGRTPRLTVDLAGVRRSALLGLLTPFAYYAVLMQAYSVLPAQEAMALNYTWPVVLVVFSIPMLGQRMSWGRVVALLVSFAGVLVIATHGRLSEFRFTNAFGDALALGSAAIWALYWIFNVKDSRDGLSKLFLNLVFGALYLLAATLIFSHLKVPSLRGILAIVYIGLFETGITFVLWMSALKKSSSTALVSQLVYLSPFLGMIWIRLILREAIHPATFVGLVLVVGGILVQQALTPRGVGETGGKSAGRFTSLRLALRMLARSGLRRLMRRDRKGVRGRGFGMRILFVMTMAIGILLSGCSNNPFPRQDETYKVRYMGFSSAPKTLDPAVGYTAGMSAEIRASVYETLVEYHFLKRPYELMPGLAESVPTASLLDNGHVSYTFNVRAGVFYHADPCFALSQTNQTTREMVAADFEFELKRIGDPLVISPVISPFRNIDGLKAFGDSLQEKREEDPEFAKRPIHEQYEQIGAVAGIRTPDSHTLVVELEQPYPQLLYWFAMPFAAAVPWEAVVYYDGKDGRPQFRDHPVGTGPYYVDVYDKEFRIVLRRNETWYGLQHPEWKAPAATYPETGSAEDEATGMLSPDYAGKPLAFMEHFEYRRDKEAMSSFGKFLQGYYDSSGISKERFDSVVQENELSDEMNAKGIRLVKSVSPSISYLAFNMEDAVVGHVAGDRGKKLRQAMSLAIDSKEFNRVFANGRGIPAQSPVPPGTYGYDPDYRNRHRQKDIEKARQIMIEAGYPNGIDPDTDQPLRLTFDTADTSSAGLLTYQFYTDAWRAIGLDVRVDATNGNQFQEKIRNGAYQIFIWGWIADYPDPENFLFLLWSEMARSRNNGPNSANFANAKYDELFSAMRRRENDPERLRIIREMVLLLEEECPWIPLTHWESYLLYHEWYKNAKPTDLMVPTFKYQDVDTVTRSHYQIANNRPIRWPLYVALIGLVAMIVPAVITFFRERQ
jgi:oligopeptide transport system substrate-binding protein